MGAGHRYPHPWDRPWWPGVPSARLRREGQTHPPPKEITERFWRAVDKPGTRYLAGDVQVDVPPFRQAVQAAAADMITYCLYP